jgi:hypothetical protein
MGNESMDVVSCVGDLRHSKSLQFIIYRCGLNFTVSAPLFGTFAHSTLSTINRKRKLNLPKSLSLRNEGNEGVHRRYVENEIAFSKKAAQLRSREHFHVSQETDNVKRPKPKKALQAF